jgi:hypothetical protein
LFQEKQWSVVSGQWPVVSGQLKERQKAVALDTLACLVFTDH